ncbi:MAG: hypothetical protein J5864_09925, partial [Oscillospiraceae bacterium]|nr:hypothetical protein [Oscillospiraceae bacterium]
FQKVYEKIITDANYKVGIYNIERRSYQKVTLNLILLRIDSYCYGYSQMFNDKGDRVFFSDIFGKEFEYLDEDIYDINEISLEDNTVSVTTKEYNNLTLDLNPDHINMDYIRLPVKTEMGKTKN